MGRAAFLVAAFAAFGAGPGASAQPAARDWTAAPLTPGRWSYTGGAAPSASYAGFTIRCPAPGRIALSRAGASGPLTFRTTSASRTLAAAELPAADPLLDALAFSRGRFAVEAAGAPTLIVPAWPELARVVEDCRR